MAISTNTYSPALPALFDRFMDMFRNGLQAYVDGHSRRAEIEALQAKSDAALAEIGISRDRIVQYVFSDRFWI